MFAKLCSDTPASKVMLDKGSRTARFGTNEYSTQQLLSGNSISSTTLIQEETVDLRLRREPVETEAKKANNAKMEADLKKAEARA